MRITFVIVLGLWAGNAGCQSYRPLTIDLDAHDKSWSMRSLGDARVIAYANELARMNPNQAAPFDPSDGLALHEAELVALVFNPALRLARLEAKVPLLGAKEAGRWQDPELAFDLLRIVESVKDPWIVGTSLSFTVPISGRLAIEKEKVHAEMDVARYLALLAEWSLVGRLRETWVRWTGTTRRIALIESYLKQLDGIVELAAKQRQANRIGSPQLRVLQLEKVGRIGQLNTLRITEQRWQLSIKALLGLTPNAPLDLQPSFTLDVRHVADEPRAQLRTHNLQLTVARAQVEVTERAYRLEIRKQYPDLSMAPGYENEEDVSRAGFSLRIPVPILNRNRRGIAESRAERDAAKAAYEAEYERLVAELAQAELGVRAAEASSRYLEDRVAPLVDQQMKDLQRLAALGDLDVLVILDALTRTLETKFQILDAKVEQAVTVNTLLSLLSPLKTPHPKTDHQENE